ncbi:FG-GAP repeat domain-containing protein [Marinicella sp. W31]|uniref:FG-GAP repeat domain-containing protein n=1 Tax=Marinicella sp. W31 TaxID=3023713 RepID=UPI0037575469
MTVVSSAWAQPWQVTEVFGPSQNGLVETKSIDFDLDGDLDVLAISLNDGNIRLYENDGDLNFKQTIISREARGAIGLHVAHLNGDQYPDFAVVSAAAGIAGVFYNQNGEQFQLQIVANRLKAPIDVVTTDINRDGLNDLVVASFQGNSIDAYIQQNGGLFVHQQLLDGIVNPRELFVVDLNNDGWNDILAASSGDNSIWWLKSNQDETFAATKLAKDENEPLSVTACQLDGQRGLDVVYSSSGNNAVYALLQEPEPEKFERIVIGQNFARSRQVGCADINNDNLMDIALTSTGDGILRELRQVDNFEFSEITVSNVNDGIVSLELVDFDGDKRLEILTEAFFEKKPLIFLNQLDGYEPLEVFNAFPDGAYGVDVGDFNADGILDVTSVSLRDNAVRWYEKTPQGFTSHLVSDNVEGARGVVAVDLDQNGSVDLLSSGAFDDTFRWHRNDGNGNFEEIVIFDNANNAAGLTATDVNGDKVLDVVTTSTLDDTVRWFSRQGESFTEHIIDTEADGAFAVESVDIDGDQDQDLLVANFIGNSIVLYENDGAAQFTKRIISENKTKPFSIAWGDMDGDGDLDVISSASSDNAVWWHEQQANLTFTDHLISDSIDKPQGLVVQKQGRSVINIFISAGVSNAIFRAGVGENAQITVTQILENVRGAIDLAVYDNNEGQLVAASSLDDAVRLLVPPAPLDLIFRNGFD